MTQDDGYTGNMGLNISETHEENLNVNEFGSAPIDGANNSFDLETQLNDALAALNAANDEIRTLTLALQMLKDFAIAEGLDLSRIGFEKKQKPLQKKPTELTKTEIASMNGQVTQRQAQKRAFSTEALPQPTGDELLKIYNDRIKEANEKNPSSQSIVDLFLKPKEEKAIPLDEESSD